MVVFLFVFLFVFTSVFIFVTSAVILSQVKLPQSINIRISTSLYYISLLSGYGNPNDNTKIIDVIGQLTTSESPLTLTLFTVKK